MAPNPHSLHFVNVDAWDPSSPEWHRLLRQLPAHEQQQVTRFVFAKDQKLALASRLLQRKLIHELFGVDYDTIDIARTPENKPYWKRSTESPAPPSWNYNVSHHGTVVAIASDSRALVGVDVVRLTDRPKRKTSVEEFFGAFADHFNPGEWKYIREIEDEDEQYSRFYRLWSLKEAYIKAVGIGLGFSLLRADVGVPGLASVGVGLGNGGVNVGANVLGLGANVGVGVPGLGYPYGAPVNSYNAPPPAVNSYNAAPVYPNNGAPATVVNSAPTTATTTTSGANGASTANANANAGNNSPYSSKTVTVTNGDGTSNTASVSNGNGAATGGALASASASATASASARATAGTSSQKTYRQLRSVE
ncbi:L-aminoadipate-semialdehyde dehydrogenase-phosphopantetheinyl transferase [Phytophthora cinnamomi]|uniref:L-aminoadipate-semialdehyde dehydrogenase-phosphopantetheinyl transferase n=1 Tax=Phytophthora cinnamomi TaxID=4785 RepID=UPI00355A9FF6|nr:L-aminoadipate-semialdehyde dehydrogenase-phosphopantetheinyl transferase [Phytophthora cinnamomi]